MSTTGNNPYQSPQSNVQPAAPTYSNEFIDGGRSLPAGNGTSWIGGGWRLFTQAPGIWILNIILLFVLSMVLAFIPFLGSLLSNLLMPVVIGGLMLGCRALEGGEQLKVEHLFAGFKAHAGPLMLVGGLMLAASIVIFIIAMIPVFILLGGSFLEAMSGEGNALANLIGQYGFTMIMLLLLIMMALFIPLSMAYWFAPALVVFHGMDAIAAMKQSFRGCLRNIVPFLIYGIILFLLAIVAIIPIGLGFLVLVPMIYGSMYVAYKDIYAN